MPNNCAPTMNNYFVVCVLLGTVCSAFFADSLQINIHLTGAAQDPCPANFTGIIPNPEDCYSFFICDAGIPGLIPCPAGLCFNPEGVEGGACDHCELVPGCESATGQPSSSPSTPSTPGSSSESPEPSSTTTQPPPNTSTTPGDTTTAQSSTTTQRTTTPSGEDLTCPPDVPYIYMPYPGDCNKFYYCQNGINSGVYNCGVGLWFHFTQQVCAVPWGASCES